MVENLVDFDLPRDQLTIHWRFLVLESEIRQHSKECSAVNATSDHLTAFKLTFEISLHSIVTKKLKWLLCRK